MQANDRRVIIVTGASRGLGREIALRFGSEGCRVVVNYRERDADARNVVREIVRSGGDAMVVRADVGRSDETAAMMSEAVARWGTIDVLVNNAGITADALAVRMADADWDRVLDTNLKGSFLCMRAAGRVMERRRSGHIISVSSLSGVRGREGQANYAASKAGLIGLTRAAAIELGISNIQVNCVLPGYLPTDMTIAAREGVAGRALEENALGRTSSPSEVASFIYHLSLMQNVSGQTFNLDSRIL